MKNFYRAALLAALGFGGVTAAHAQAATDLFIGFNDAAGPTSAQNDYVIDIGSFSAVTAAANAHGGSVDLMSANAPLQNYQSTFVSTFGTAFSSDPSEVNDVAAGVVGGQTTTTPKQLWQTMPLSVTPVLGPYNASSNPHTLSGSQISTAAAEPQTLYNGGGIGEYASTSTTGWTYVIAQSPTLVGTDGSGNLASQSGQNPMGQVSGGDIILNLWEDNRTSAAGQTTTGWVDEGYFTFSNLGTGSADFTYTIGPYSMAPEPAAYGMMAGGLLLALAAGRRLVPRIKRAN